MGILSSYRASIQTPFALDWLHCYHERALIFFSANLSMSFLLDLTCLQLISHPIHDASFSVLILCLGEMTHLIRLRATYFRVLLLLLESFVFRYFSSLDQQELFKEYWIDSWSYHQLIEEMWFLVGLTLDYYPACCYYYSFHGAYYLNVSMKLERSY